MHGKDTDPSQKWYPWLAQWCSESSIEFHAPILPDSSDPHMSDWIASLEATQPDEETVLVGHSRGGVAILRWLEGASDSLRVKKVILVATNSGFESRMFVPGETNHGFYSETGFDFEKITTHSDSFVVLHSKDDPWVPYEQGIENSEGLGAHLVTVDGYQHFGKGVQSIPELVECLQSD